jgi:hypothetical protein
MTHPNRRANDAEIEARRRKVASALLAGSDNFTSIAKELGVSKPTITRDVAHIEEQWRAESTQDIAVAKGRDLKRTDRLISAMWPLALTGDTKAVAAISKLLDQRAKLLGLNAPEKRELSTANDIPLKIIIENIGAEVVE